MFEKSTYTYRAILFVTVICIIPLGLATKVYQGQFEEWITQYAGDILYQILWTVLICMVWTRLSPAKIAIGVFLASSVIEFLQLWHPPFLQAARSYLLGKLILGTTFVWWDFFYYCVGSILAWLWIRHLQSKFLPHRTKDYGLNKLHS